MKTRTRLSFTPYRGPLDEALAERDAEEALYGVAERREDPSFGVSMEEPVNGVRIDLLPPGIVLYRGAEPIESTPATKAWRVAALLSSGVAAAHGYLRSDGSLWSAFCWAFMGGAFPIAVPIVAIYQGFGVLDPKIAAAKATLPAPAPAPPFAPPEPEPPSA